MLVQNGGGTRNIRVNVSMQKFFLGSPPPKTQKTAPLAIDCEAFYAREFQESR